jgi:hypothetical protein
MTAPKRFGLVLIASLAASAPAVASAKPFLKHFKTIATLSSAAPKHGSAKGDENPYGVAVVPRTSGRLVKGDVLVSNFNNSQNQQGTGSSVVEISPAGHLRVFATVPQPTSTAAVGLTTALVALKRGYVIVGSLPAPGGNSSAAGAGALTILNSDGAVVETLKGGDIDGPWDMTAVDQDSTAVLFVTNVLNGTVAAGGKVVHGGTVMRITLSVPRNGAAPTVTSNHVIATGFAEHTDPNALIVGPTGVGLGNSGSLYVADSNGNRIAAIPDALTRMSALGGGGTTLSSGGSLNDPLGLTIAPNGDVLSFNGADGNAVETTPGGQQIVTKQLVANGAGDLFGAAIAPHGKGLYFVNDNGSGPTANSLALLH